MVRSSAALILLLVISTPLFAGIEFEILTPEHKTRLYDKTVQLVAATTGLQKEMTALVSNKSGVKRVKGKVLKKDKGFAFHSLISLETGVNEITVGGESLSIFYSARYQWADKWLEIRKAAQKYPPYLFHTPEKEALCSKCHDMAAMRTRPKPDCFECHGELRSVQYVHGPLGEGVCFVCHDSGSLPSSFAPRLEGKAGLCYGCHQDWIVRQLKKQFFHTPVKKGDCTMCHDPHGSPFKFHLPVDQKGLCYICHEQKEIMAGKNVHAPLRSKGCGVCHDPHSSDFRGHLLDSEKSLCSQAECHPEFAAITEHHPVRNHPVMGKFGPEMNLSCSSCHNPHSSDFSSLLPGDRQTFCSKCHKDMRFFREKDRGLPWDRDLPRDRGFPWDAQDGSIRKGSR